MTIFPRMGDITVSKLKKDLVVRYDGGHVLLPADMQKEVDEYWKELIRSGKRYTRGEVFTVIGKTEMVDSIAVTVSRTDFAHNLFCRDVRSPEGYGIRIIHTAALVETSDGKVVFGRMSVHTANPLRYQLCGGGIDDHDIRDGVFDLDAPLISVLPDGRVGGVRVLSHRETPGLGDKIDEAKSDWIYRFNGKSLDQPTLDQWAVKRDGGTFDQFTGATITPRAIVTAVKNALLYVQSQGARLYGEPPVAQHHAPEAS